MNYYEIWVNSNGPRNNVALTYRTSERFLKGNIVSVPIRNKSALGIVYKKVSKPAFKTKEIYNLIIDQTISDNSMELIEWMINYYPAPIGSILQLFLPKNLIKLAKVDDSITTISPLLSINNLSLTIEQRNAISIINKSPNRTILLHGITGSGKTRVYSELIDDKVKSGKSTILLTPEIGLTPQLVNSMEEIFGKRVIVMHSALSDKIRRENWIKILLSLEPLLIIGPRSALFVPLKDLGLIIIDEAHENSYKQDRAPYYQTTRVAAKLAEISGSKLILGTATPLISDYYVLNAKGSNTVRMTKLASTKMISPKPPDIVVTDLSDRSEFTKSYWLNDKLIASINKSLESHEQSLIFLNRRGTALVILCSACGWQSLCPNCDTSLTYHGDSHSMMCHSCGYHALIPVICPVCGSSEIIFKGAGTKAIEAELNKLFPMAKIMRFDRDNSKKDSLAENYNDLLTGKVDIIIGTQIIIKGLDLPKLSTVGIVMADHNLYFPDYTAAETTYQMLTQVIGRVARGHREGRVFIQTYNKNGEALNAALSKNFDVFYNSQIKEREKYEFPPFVYLLKLQAKRSSSKNAQRACEIMMRNIEDLRLPIKINGPMPSFHKKINGKYVWQLILKSTNRNHLLKVIYILSSNWAYDIDPTTLL